MRISSEKKERIISIECVFFLLWLIIGILLLIGVGMNASFHCGFVLEVFRIHVLVYLIEKHRVASRILDWCQVKPIIMN